MKPLVQRSHFVLGVCALSLCTALSPANAADPVYLNLKANGTDIQGESLVKSLGRENSIECLYFEQNVQTPRDAATGMATGKRTYDPITIVKRIDKSSPLLFKALVTNQVIEGRFRFFRPNPTGDGTTEQFYTVEIKGGRINSVRQVSQALDPATSKQAPMEEVTFSFQTISWIYTNGGVQHEDTISGQATIAPAKNPTEVKPILPRPIFRLPVKP